MSKLWSSAPSTWRPVDGVVVRMYPARVPSPRLDGLDQEMSSATASDGCLRVRLGGESNRLPTLREMVPSAPLESDAAMETCRPLGSAAVKTPPLVTESALTPSTTVHVTFSVAPSERSAVSWTGVPALGFSVSAVITYDADGTRWITHGSKSIPVSRSSSSP